MRPLGLVLRAYGLDDETARHWQRIVFAWVHGFAALRRQSLLTLPVSVEATIELFVDAAVHQLARAPQRH